MKPKRPTHITPDAAKLSQAPLGHQYDLEEKIAAAGGAPPKVLGEKGREQAYLDSIRPQIEKAAKEAAERRKLTATVEAQQKLARERRKPILEQSKLSPAVGKYRQEQKAKRRAVKAEEKLAAISVQVAKERERRQKAALQDNSPTPERLAKLVASDPSGKRAAAAEELSVPIKDEDTLSTAKVHKVQGVVGFYQKQWTYEELQGARYLIRIWDEATERYEPKVTPSYEGTPVTAATFGPRSGGMAEKAYDAHTLKLSIEGMLYTRFGAKGVNIVKWFAWETLRAAREGAPLGDQMVAAGRALAPFVGEHSKDRLWGITMGWLQSVFRFAYGQWVVPEEAERRREASRSTDAEIASRRRLRQAQLEHAGVVADEEIAATRKGLTVVRGGRE